MIGGIDVGFGWTKVVTDDNSFKFPSWIAYHTPSPVSELDTVRYGNKNYVVGRDVKYEAQRIETTGITELINYFPVFLKHIETITGKLDRIVTGVPVIHKDHLSALKETIQENGVECDILPQGIGIFIDTENRVQDEVLVLDIGFNTLDYFVLVKNGGWKKKRGNTVEKFGLIRAVDMFRSTIPDKVGYAKNFSFSRLLEIFEKGTLMFDGEGVDLTSIKRAALEEYAEMVTTRLREEIGESVYDMETVIIAGGGANTVKVDIFKNSRVIIPEAPEYSQARGYLKHGMELWG
jgi:hypothetical protein